MSVIDTTDKFVIDRPVAGADFVLRPAGLETTIGFTKKETQGCPIQSLVQLVLFLDSSLSILLIPCCSLTDISGLDFTLIRMVGKNISPLKFFLISLKYFRFYNFFCFSIINYK